MDTVKNEARNRPDKLKLLMTLPFLNWFCEKCQIEECLRRCKHDVPVYIETRILCS